MIEHDIQADFRYAAAPKAVPHAFLIADIQKWTQYNLLDGPVNLYLKRYLSGSILCLDLGTIGDTLSLSIGRDQDIVIQREIEVDYTKRKILGVNKKETRGWITSIKNNKRVPISIKNRRSISDFKR